METSTDNGHVTELRQGPPIFVVSGGTGATGELLARTVLAQFPNVSVPLIVEIKVLGEEQVRAVIRQAAGIPGAIILHTMVNRTCRKLLLSEASTAGVVTFDLAGPLEEHLSRELGLEPLGQPGLYRHLHKSYFDRIEAIEFTVAHDDGKRVEDLPQRRDRAAGRVACGQDAAQHVSGHVGLEGGERALCAGGAAT